MRHGPPPPNPFTDLELRWLWEKFERCRFSPATYVKRFARNNRFEQLTDDKGKPMAAHLAFQYRRQIFKDSAKWDRNQFISAVKNTVRREINIGEWSPPEPPKPERLPNIELGSGGQLHLAFA